MPSSPRVAAGRHRHRVELHAPAIGDDAHGQPVEGDATVGAFWAEVEPLAGAEAIVSEQLRGSVTHVVRLRAGRSLAVAPMCWFLWLDRGRARLDVLGVVDVGGVRRKLEVLCREVPAQLPGN